MCFSVSSVILMLKDIIWLDFCLLLQSWCSEYLLIKWKFYQCLSWKTGHFILLSLLCPLGLKILWMYSSAKKAFMWYVCFGIHVGFCIKTCFSFRHLQLLDEYLWWTWNSPYREKGILTYQPLVCLVLNSICVIEQLFVAANSWWYSGCSPGEGQYCGTFVSIKEAVLLISGSYLLLKISSLHFMSTKLAGN